MPGRAFTPFFALSLLSLIVLAVASRFSGVWCVPCGVDWARSPSAYSVGLSALARMVADSASVASSLACSRCVTAASRVDWLALLLPLPSAVAARSSSPRCGCISSLFDGPDRVPLALVAPRAAALLGRPDDFLSSAAAARELRAGWAGAGRSVGGVFLVAMR
jgi:hypothetical protein